MKFLRDLRRTVSSWTHPGPARLAFGVLFAFVPTSFAADLQAVEDEWAKAQQTYYEELKKLKAPRDPQEVTKLKDRILAPSKKALEEAYREAEREKDAPPTATARGNTGDSSDTGGSRPSAPPPEPAMVLDGKGVKREIRYTKKGAPEDMTAEESPESLGPLTLTPTTAESTGEISYSKKKKPEPKKPAQDLRKSAQ